MIKKIYPFLTVLMLALFVGACSSEDVMPDIDAGATGRTITLTASMPDEDAPSTRVTATELASRAITLTWDVGDRIDFLFIQGENKKSAEATVTSVDATGKNATFTIALPDGIDPANAYTLYGVYGGSGDITEGKIGVAAQTAEGNVGKNIMLRFEKEVAANSNNIGNLQFEHLGFLFTTKIKVTTGDVNSITDINLFAPDNSNWIYKASDYEFNIETGAFTTTATATNAASFGHKVIEGDIITVRSWFPKANEEAWPALKLKINGTTETTTQKSAGNNPAVGKAYYLYAKYDGTKLDFSIEGFPDSEAVYADDLFFSEYIEGDSNNKYLEIYNGTGAAVDLSDYEVVLYSNGATERGNNVQLTGTLAQGAVFVIANANANLYDGADVTSTVTYFNGDDAVALQKISSGDYVDIIGRIGEQVKWDAGGDLKTEDRTLVRKPTVTGGVTENPASGFPTLATEWIGYPIDTSEHLGSHETDFGAFFGADETPIEFDSSLNLTKVINISTSETWGARSDKSWLTVTPASGTGSGNVTLTATENTAETSRTATVTLTATGANAFDPIVVTVTQKAFEASIIVDPASLTFEKEAGTETIAVTANVAWTATSDAAWATISPASGTNDGAITVNVEANTGEAERTATITITGDGIDKTVAVTQAAEGSGDLLFPGSDFNDWSAFTGALNGNVVFGEKSTDGGIGGSGALLLNGTHGSKNGFSFTAKVPEGFSAAGKTEITFWIKGTSTGKALSMNVYTGTGTQPGTDYEAYNIESGTTSDVVLEPTGTNNYDGSINTGEEWIKVTLNISSIANNINTTQGQNLFAIRLGKTGVYDLLVDDIMIK